MIRKMSVAGITTLFICFFMVCISNGEEKNKENTSNPTDKAARTYSRLLLPWEFSLRQL